MPKAVSHRPDSGRRGAILKTDAKLQIAWAEVYAPGVPDSQGDFATADEIRKMAHDFARDGKLGNVDREHDNRTFGASIVETFIARKGDPDFIPGSWVVGVHIPDQETWEQVEKGELNGFSFDGDAIRSPSRVALDMPEILGGFTTEHDGHRHRFVVKYDQNGRFLGGETDEVNGHKHVIKRGTVTEDNSGHVHRFSFVEAINASH